MRNQQVEVLPRLENKFLGQHPPRTGIAVKSEEVEAASIAEDAVDRYLASNWVSFQSQAVGLTVC